MYTKNTVVAIPPENGYAPYVETLGRMLEYCGEYTWDKIDEIAREKYDHYGCDEEDCELCDKIEEWNLFSTEKPTTYEDLQNLFDYPHLQIYELPETRERPKCSQCGEFVRVTNEDVWCRNCHWRIFVHSYENFMRYLPYKLAELGYYSSCR